MGVMVQNKVAHFFMADGVLCDRAQRLINRSILHDHHRSARISKSVQQRVLEVRILMPNHQ